MLHWNWREYGLESYYKKKVYLQDIFAGAGVLLFVMANSNIRGRQGYTDVNFRDAYGTVCLLKLMTNM